ncbi:MAG: 30S ribosomal protein S13 [Candidatus Pacebacteria bacterium]|nr:30S ribosomal protein S13 [Candidatus Paceibacterota bacterium]
MRIQGITLPDKKRMEIALTAIYGIGRPLSIKILNEAKVDINKKASEVSPEEENTIRAIVDALQIEGDLRREVSSNIKRLKDIGSYRGSRHAKRLPARGQRTKTNTRTLRGNVVKTMGSGKKSVDKK